MRFGLRLSQFVGEPRRLVQLAAQAEQAGFDEVWFPSDPFLVNTWVLTSAVAARTKTIGVGALGINPHTIDPSEIATYVATLDLLSEGRALAGIGMHTDQMLAWTGHDASNYITRTREAVEIVRRLLQGEVVDYRGQSFHWTDECYLRFQPLRAEVPLYVSQVPGRGVTRRQDRRLLRPG